MRLRKRSSTGGFFCEKDVGNCSVDSLNSDCVSVDCGVSAVKSLKKFQLARSPQAFSRVCMHLHGSPHLDTKGDGTPATGVFRFGELVPGSV